MSVFYLTREILIKQKSVALLEGFGYGLTVHNTFLKELNMEKHWKDPIHPGEHLADEMKEIGLNGRQLALRLNVPFHRVYQILRGERGITASTALKLGKFFSGSGEIWINLQKTYDMDIALQKEGEEIKKIQPYVAPVENSN